MTKTGTMPLKDDNRDRAKKSECSFRCKCMSEFFSETTLQFAPDSQRNLSSVKRYKREYCLVGSGDDRAAWASAESPWRL